MKASAIGLGQTPHPALAAVSEHRMLEKALSTARTYLAGSRPTSAWQQCRAGGGGGEGRPQVARLCGVFMQTATGTGEALESPPRVDSSQAGADVRRQGRADAA